MEELINLQPLFEEGIGIILILVSALVGFGVKWGLDRLGIKDAETRAVLEDLINRLITLTANRIKEEGKDFTEVEVKNELVRRVAQEINTQVPKLVKKYNIMSSVEDYVESLVVERFDIETKHMVEDKTATKTEEPKAKEANDNTTAE